MHVELRQATASDLDVVYEVTEATMREYVEQAFGPWIEAFQRKLIGDSFSPATHQIVSVGGETAGILSAASHDTHVQLEKLFILPAFQGRGIGARLLGDVAQAAAAQRKPVRLRVLAVNTGARRFYERCGFIVYDATPERLFMEYVPTILREVGPR